MARILSISAKCSDLFTAVFRDEDKPETEYQGYVPKFFPDEHWGDYVCLDIDIDTGQITNWKTPSKKDLAIFKPVGDGTEGQDRENYSDTQDRKTYR